MSLDGQERCMGCMKPLNWDGRCNCGFDQKSYPSDSHYLPLGSFLENGNYMVGKVLGEGGFGITYIGLDSKLLSRVAIKEYYPAGFAGRDISNGTYNVCAYASNEEEVYKKGLDAFLNEARILAQFSRMEGIVKVYRFFEENKTAYIVMEYVEGVSIKNYVQKYGRIKSELVLKMMEQPIRALQAVHEANLVHRDVSADNLMIGQNGKITLIDFGAARSSNMMDERTRTAICKQGFSALEQYSGTGKQGPWTDVYGICTTMYYMLTGIVPQNATERITDDEVVPLGKMDDILLGQDKKEALMTGMAVKSSERFQNMEALYSALYGKLPESYIERDIVFPKEEKQDAPVEKVEPDRKTNWLTALLGEALQNQRSRKSRQKRKKLFGRIVGGAVAAIVLALIAWNLRGVFPVDAGAWKQTGKNGLKQQAEARPTETPESSKGASGNQIKPVSETNSTPKVTPQASSTPWTDSTPQASSTPQGAVSKVVKMPKVSGLKKAEAVRRIEKQGLRYRVVSRNSSKFAVGIVIRASISEGKIVEKGKQIILYVSKGKKVVATPKPTTVPRPKVTPEPSATKRPTATKKPSSKQDDNLAGDLDTILY